MKQVTINVYQFDELNDDAKEEARNWYRECIDSDDFTACIEGIQERLGWLGFRDPDISWSLGYTQSDHATLRSVWHAKDVEEGKVEKEWPGSEEEGFLSIAKEFERLSRKQPEAVIKFDGSMTIAGELSGINEPDSLSGEFETEFMSVVKNLNSWMYHYIRGEGEFLYSAEHVDGTIRANEYGFTEDGKRFTQGE